MTLFIVVEEIPPFYVKRFENTEKQDVINVTNYYIIIIIIIESSKEQHFILNIKNLLHITKSLLSLLIKFAK